MSKLDVIATILSIIADLGLFVGICLAYVKGNYVTLLYYIAAVLLLIKMRLN